MTDKAKKIREVMKLLDNGKTVKINGHGELWLGHGDLRKEESHHDGSNSILYRYWKNGLTEEQKENFLNKIYNGECTQKDITRYTRKAGVGIANAFGWTVRGGENKYKKVA